MPSRSEGRGGAEREPDRAKPKYLFKVRAQRVPCGYSRSAPIRTRIASRKFIWNALRAGFEQTAPPSLREGSPPDSGGEFSISTSLPKSHVERPYIALGVPFGSSLNEPQQKRFLMKYLQTHNTFLFVYYRITLGIVVLLAFFFIFR